MRLPILAGAAAILTSSVMSATLPPAPLPINSTNAVGIKVPNSGVAWSLVAQFSSPTSIAQQWSLAQPTSQWIAK